MHGGADRRHAFRNFNDYSQLKAFSKVINKLICLGVSFKCAVVYMYLRFL